MLTVAEIMSREPYTLGPDDSLADARGLMAQHHIRHVPIVTDDAVLVGLVSQRDVLAAGDSSVPTDLPVKRAADERDIALSSIMTSPVKTVDENASLRGTAMLLQRNRVGCLPVVEDGRLVGIITDSDFVTIAINLMEQLETAEPDFSEDNFDEAPELAL